jgi:hypothetical protein
MEAGMRAFSHSLVCRRIIRATPINPITITAIAESDDFTFFLKISLPNPNIESAEGTVMKGNLYNMSKNQNDISRLNTKLPCKGSEKINLKKSPELA